jgi:hypothetical protein
VEFSFCTEKDSGMYDAINRGFAHLNPEAGAYMTYINSDDRLLPGALQFAAGVFCESRDIAWLGGRPCEMNERGELMHIHEEQVFPTASLRAGLHDGRALCFVMQEGTFWRAELWKESGGFRTSLRQAGDWDLWRRFAEQTPYITVDVVLAAHRRRGAQLTADKGAYYREVDDVVARELANLHRTELERFREAEDNGERRFYGKLLRFHADAGDGGRGQWRVEERPYEMLPKSPIAVTNGFTTAMIGAEFESGFGTACGSDVALNLLPGFRVSKGANGSLRFHARREGLHRVFLRCRNFDPGVSLRLTNETRTIFHAELPVTGHGREFLAIAESVFHAGPNVIATAITGTDPQKVPILILVSCEAMSTIG